MSILGMVRLACGFFRTMTVVYTMDVFYMQFIHIDFAWSQVKLELKGAAGCITVEVQSHPSPTNPKTSYIVSLAVIKAIRNLASPVFIGI